MIELPWISLDLVHTAVQNLGLIAMLVLLYHFIPDTLVSRSKLFFSLSIGIVFGFAAALSIPSILAQTGAPVVGINIVLIPLSGFIGGPVSSVFVAMVLLLASAASSGALSSTDILTVMSGLLLGALFYQGRSWRYFPRSSIIRLLLLGIGVAIIEFCAFSLTFALRSPYSPIPGLPDLTSIFPFLLISCGATVLLGSIIVFIDRKKQAEKELLRYHDHLESLVKERTAELEQVNSLQKATIESTADAIVAVDTTGVIRSYNQKAAQILDLPVPPSSDRPTHLSDDMPGAKIFPESTAAVLEDPSGVLPLIAYLPESAEQVVTRSLRFRNGRIYELYVHPHVIGDRSIGRVWSFHDITEQKRAQEALHESEKNLRAVLDNIPDLVLVHRNGIIIYVNPSMSDTMGIRPDDVRNKPILEFIPAEYHARVAAAIRERTAAGRDKPYEIELVSRIMGRRILLVRGTVIEFDGAPSILNVLTDITEQTRVQEALRKSEEKFRSYVENANDIIYSLTVEGIFTYVSPKWTELLGHGIHEVIGKSFDSFIHPADLFACQEFVRQVLMTGEKKSGIEYRIRHRNGTWQWHTTTASPLRDDEGNIVSFLGICRDITERKSAEEAIAAINNKLILLSTITRHDIFNQMTALSGYVELFDIKNRDPATTAQVNAMKKSLEVIRLQLEFTRDYQELGLKKPVWQNVEAAFTKAAESFGEKNIVFRCGTDNLEILADPMLGKVFYNFIDNSLRHGERISEIRLCKEKADPDLLVVYEDNGVGVKPDEKEKIFEKGFGKHTGLGMFLIKEILSISGISVRENGTWQQGVRFEIRVPAGKFRFA
jgi:PAS domain S-box-containing protein